MRNKHRYIISGGGTGGHIFPAIAIANGLKAKYPSAEILFVGANGKMEMEKVPQAGYKIIGLNIQGFYRQATLKNLTVIFKFFISIIRSITILSKFKPSVVIGVGGYASSAILTTAQLLNYKTIIQEQNSLPGKTNKFVAKRTNAICVAYQGLDKYFSKDKIFLTGNPVRKEITDIVVKDHAAFNYFNINDESKKIVLFIGGSQGAKAINDTVFNNINKIKNHENTIFIWQTGTNFFEQAKTEIIKQNINNILCFDFIKQMNYAYSIADVVVSRAGALAISELCLAGLPTILVPLPTAAEDHQMQNAKNLETKNAAIIIENSKVDDMLMNAVFQLLNDYKKRNELKNNIKSLAVLNTVEKIIEVIDKITNNDGPQ